MIMLLLPLMLGLVFASDLFGSDDTDETAQTETDDQLLNTSQYADTVLAGESDDIIFGQGGDDLVSGGTGNDQLVGGTGNDIVFGGKGDDILRGSSGDDILMDDEGSDTIYGDTGNDQIIANGFLDMDALVQSGSDSGVSYTDLSSAAQLDYSQDTDLEGDYLSGGYGNDAILFGIDDTVSGGEGNDILIGGDWISGHSAATITDFEPTEDYLLYSVDANTAAPTITIAHSAGATTTDGDTLVYADGVHVMTLLATGNLTTVNDIVITYHA